MTQPANTQQVYNLIILDESGSMESIRGSIINSFNEVVQTIRAAELKSRFEEMLQEHFVSLYTFNGEGIREVHFQVPVARVEELTKDTYRPNASTPLFDAMGRALTRHEYAIEGKENAVTLVTILTDGEENSSTEYNGDGIVAMVNRLKQKGWVFTYIGTDHDVQGFSARISISASMKYQKSSAGLASAMVSESRSRKLFYEKIKDRNFNITTANEDYFNEDEKNGGQEKSESKP